MTDDFFILCSQLFEAIFTNPGCGTNFTWNFEAMDIPLPDQMVLFRMELTTVQQPAILNIPHHTFVQLEII